MVAPGPRSATERGPVTATAGRPLARTRPARGQRAMHDPSTTPAPRNSLGDQALLSCAHPEIWRYSA
ncbi:hypothetical protein OG321_41070 [Streptomyces sp. NBC_00424]|uniref:hypothetical protein n=1 Tax=Streptomyces sp. NBC_00424 TaxID=2903648 RepID=UPI0022565F37|nr:hypothetical protein [Streptomyces sp. NBC_00424]MCX5078797.1 hypothetical protein [Streptomyces sp. NBC_00424]